MKYETIVELYPQKPAEHPLPQGLLEALEELADEATDVFEIEEGGRRYYLDGEPPGPPISFLEAYAQEGLVNLVIFYERPRHAWEDPIYTGYFLGANAAGRVVEGQSFMTNAALKPLYAVDPAATLDDNLDGLEAFYRKVAEPLREVRIARGRFPEAVAQ